MVFLKAPFRVLLVLFKVLLAALITALTLIVATYYYIEAVTGVRGGKGGSTGIDTALLPHFTIYSPVFWLMVAAILAILYWIFRHWLFASHKLHTKDAVLPS
jgi:hypothetical protein